MSSINIVPPASEAENVPDLHQSFLTNLRTPGLGQGTIWLSDDFSAPLPDDFWFSPTDPLRQESVPELVMPVCTDLTNL